MFGKMTAGEKSARALFDTSMKLGNITLGGLGIEGKKGQLFDYQALSEMTKKDLPQALNILSEMYMKGQLSSQTMQKMFTARHFMEIQNLLIDINGNVNGFVDGIAKGVNYSNDFYKKMFDINEQMKVFKNNWQSMGGGVGSTITKAGTGLLMELNDILPNLNNGIGSIASGIGAVGIAFAGASLGAGVFVKTLMPLIVAGGAWGIALGALVAGIGTLGYKMYETKKESADTGIIMNNNLLIAKESLRLVESEKNIRHKMLEDFKQFESTQKNGFRYLDEAVTMTGLLLSKNTELRDTLEAVRNVPLASKENFGEIGSDDYMAYLEKVQNRISAINTQQQALYNNLFGMVDKHTSKLAENIQMEESRGINERNRSKLKQVEGWKKDLEALQYIKSEYSKAIESGGAIDLKQVSDTLKSDFGSDMGVLVENLGYNDVAKFNEEMKESGRIATILRDKYKEMSELSREAFKNMTQQATEYQNTYNRVIADTNQSKLRLFELEGSYKGQKDFGGLLQILSENEVDRATSSIQEVENKIEIAKNRLSELKNMDKSSMEAKDIVELDQLPKEIERMEVLRKSTIQYKEDSASASDKELASLAEGITYTRETADVFMKIYLIKSMIESKRILTPNDKAGLEALEKWLSEEVKVLGAVNKQIVSKQRKTDYQLKYNDYVKENLSVELELAKIMKTQGEQAMLNYEYKKKELEINRELAKEDIGLAKAQLSESGYKGEISTATQAQGALRELSKKHGHVTQSEGVKDQFEAMKVLVQALAKEEKLVMEIALQPLKEFENIMKNMPSTMKSAYSALSGMNSSPLSQFNIQYADQLAIEISSALDKVKNSWKDNDSSFFGGLNTGNIDTFIGGSIESVASARKQAESAMLRREQGEELTNQELKYIEILMSEENKLKDLIDLKDKILEKEKTDLDIQLAKLDVINKTGNALSKLGSGMGIKGLEEIGGIFEGFGDLAKFNADTTKKFEFGKLFDFKSGDFAKNLGNAMDSAFQNIDLGTTIGSWIGGITGGGASSQAGGALGGLIGALGGGEGGFLSGIGVMAGLDPTGTTALVSAGMSLVGGLFGDDGKDQEEAEKKTKEANKIYDKNTDALNKLAQNMSNLSGNVDGLNSSLISAFSRIPTFGKLTDVTSTLTDMYSTMEKTRQFNEVAYQVTKTKKGSSGFLGIGASADTSWTETIEISVQEMLNKYGFKGAIEDMTTNQLRDFSKWLEDFDMGDSDNFSVLAGAIEDYAESLDKFDKNIDRFFYDATMESFAGISSLQQEDLRQQIEDFYKNLGFQIDDEMAKVIDDMAEQMSVMVTIMQDVRGSFVDSWRDSGKTAGQTFLSSMTPYIDAMLENISQVFYDVYFSDVTDALEQEFKSLSEQLVELKKLGVDLDWSSVAGSLSGSFDKVLSAIISAKQETDSFNDVILELQKQALEAGLSLSEMLELGLVSGTQQTVLDTFKDALMSSENDGALTVIGQMVGDKIGNALADKLIDNMLADKVLQFSANLDKIVSGNMSFDSLAGLASEAMSVGMMMDEQRRRLEAIREMFDFNGDISYESQESNISYESGTSSQNVYNYYISSEVSAGTVVEADDIQSLARKLLEEQLEILRVEKGVDITRNY